MSSQSAGKDRCRRSVGIVKQTFSSARLRIEVWRLEHERPMDELRHPAIESGASLPI